jgi:Domain of unknown function (DUF4430)
MDRYKAALIGVVVASLAILAALLLAAPNKEPEKRGPAVVSVIVDFGGQAPAEAGPANGTPWNMTVRLQNGTAYGALEAAASSANFTFKSEWYPNFRSHRVTEISGVRDGTDNRYWQYYVNGVYMGTGADLTAVSDGDVVRWEFRSAVQ